MFDVEMQTGEFFDTEHLAMEYWGAAGGASATASSATAAVLNGDKKTVAAAIKDATPNFARSAELLCCLSPYSWLGAIDTDCRDCDFGCVGVTNPLTDFETADNAIAAMKRCEKWLLNIFFSFSSVRKSNDIQ